ncbi:MAG TPA: response regulator [Porticoccus sp.]|nr:response regulator [Porticoccus sp.]
MDITATSAFDHSQYMPHGMCYLWRPEILWPSAISDVVTAAAYFAFALAVISFVRRRKDLPYPSFFLLAGPVIFLACGASHLLSAVVIWDPLYGYLTGVKIVVAISSVAAAALLWRLLPLFLAIPSPSMLELKNVELEKEIQFRIDLENDMEKLNFELRKARDSAENANLARSQFMTTMSHEIRTPMNGVLGMMELLDLTELSREQEKYARIMRRSGDTLMTVINDILDYSKIEVGKLELEEIQFNLKELIEETVAPFDTVDNHGVDLVVTLDSNVPNGLKGDPTRLHQIVSNLLNNAFKFTPKGSVHLQVSAEPRDDNRAAINFSVTDTGVGMSPQVKINLFQPFTQADQSISRKYGGTGLGLSICKRLVEMMGGDISVDSEAGQGASFHFNILFDVVSESAATVAEQSGGSDDCHGLKVLVAEDNKVNQQVALGLMAKLGVKPDLVADGAAAVDIICKQQRRYDLILMDCEMPVLDGYEATRKIRQYETDHGLARTLIYALSAHVMSEHIEKCHAVGMDDYLSKPFSFNQLAAVLRKVKSTVEE